MIAEVPDVLNQLITYKLAVSIIWIIIPIITVILLTKYAMRISDYIEKNKEKLLNPPDDKLSVWLIYAVSTIGFIIVFLVNLHRFFKLVISPKVYLLEYGMNFLK